MNYREQLWEEIARNDPPMAKFIADMNKHFKTKLHTFRWIKAPKHVFCVYNRAPSVPTITFAEATEEE